jgi:hypothetical protein
VSGAPPVDLEAWPEDAGYDMPIVQSAVRHMYEDTQLRLEAAGIENVTLYRGMGREVRGDTEVDGNPASAWSLDPKVADNFARWGAGPPDAQGNRPGPGTRYEMTVPRSRILSTPTTGLGCLEEREAVVIRGRGDRARAEAPGPGRKFGE